MQSNLRNIPQPEDYGQVLLDLLASPSIAEKAIRQIGGIDYSFKDEGDIVILVGDNREELGGTEYMRLVHGVEDVGRTPVFNSELEDKVQQAVQQAADNGLVKSAYHCGPGGLAVALADGCVSGGIGVNISMVMNMRGDGLLFGESHSRIIITTGEDNVAELLRFLSVKEVSFTRLGNVTGDRYVLNLYRPGCAAGRPCNVVNIPVTEMKNKMAGGN